VAPSPSRAKPAHSPDSASNRRKAERHATSAWTTAWSRACRQLRRRQLSRFYRSRRMERSRRRRKWCNTPALDRTLSANPRHMPTASLPTRRIALRSPRISAADRVFVYRLDSAGKIAGSHRGRRRGHAPRLRPAPHRLPSNVAAVFVANELDSTVATLRFDASVAPLSPVEIGSTVPRGWTGAKLPADIHVSSSGQTLYVSNRGTIASRYSLWAKSTGALTLDRWFPRKATAPQFHPGPDQPVAARRGISGLTQLSCSPAIRERATDPTRQRIALPSPVCLRFRANAG